MRNAHQQVFKQACTILNVDPRKIRCVGSTEFKGITGCGVGRNWGRANSITYRDTGERVVYVKRGRTLDTFIHELLHHLFPHRPHWWIFAAAWELADTPAYNRGHWYGYGGSLHAEPRQIQSKDQLRRLAWRAAKRVEVEAPNE